MENNVITDYKVKETETVHDGFLGVDKLTIENGILTVDNFPAP